MREITDWIVLLPLVACGISDWKKKTIPLWLLVGFGAIAIGATLFFRPVSLRESLAGAAVGMVLLLISKCTKEAIGYGDGFIVLLLGIYMGGMKILQVLFAASVAAGVCSLFFLWKRKWKKSTTLPFLPFLMASYLGVMLV